MASRWRNSEEYKPSFSSFLKEMDVAAGNPSAAMGPAERARALGLQSNGKGGYIDPGSGQVVAQTVNGELVFYSQNRATGGAVSDSSGGAALVSDQPSWADPVTGMVTTPPGRPEGPEELASVPDPVPAKAPHGYNSFMTQQKQQMYAQDAMQQQQGPPGDMDMDGSSMVPPAMGQQPVQDTGVAEGTEHSPEELPKRMIGQPSATKGMAASKKAAQKKVDSIKDPRSKVGLSYADFQAGRTPKGKKAAAAWNANIDPKNAPGVDPKEAERQSKAVADADPVDKALDKTSPEAVGIDEKLQRQREAKMIKFHQQIENLVPDKSPVARQEKASAIAMLYALRNSATNTSGGDEDLFQKLQAVYPEMATDKSKKDWYDSFIGQGAALRNNLGFGDDDVDDNDWAVERTANRDRLDFIDEEDQQDFMQYTWDSLGDEVRKAYGSQLDSFNPADLTFARKSQLENMKGGIDKIAKEFGSMPEILPGLINSYMDMLEKAGHLHRASLKQGDTEKGVPVKGKPVNQGDMKGFDIDYDDEGSPRLWSGGFLKGQNPRTSLNIADTGSGELGFDSHSFLMSPFFEAGGKTDRYSIENKVSSLMADAVESRELPEAQPDKVPWRNIKGGPSAANARGGGIPVQELADMVSKATGEDINFRMGVRPQLKKDGTISSKYEAGEFSDEDKEWWGSRLQSLIDEQDDDGNPFFNFGDGPSFNGESLNAQDWVNRAFDMANSGADGDFKHEKKFTNGLRAKLRQFRIMQMLQSAKQKGPGELAKTLAKLKYMAKKQGIDGDMSKGGYTLYQ
jgi:hypothetical protein